MINPKSYVLYHFKQKIVVYLDTFLQEKCINSNLRDQVSSVKIGMFMYFGQKVYMKFGQN